MAKRGAKNRPYEYKSINLELPVEIHDAIVASVVSGDFRSKTQFLIEASKEKLLRMQKISA